ncbi:MAG: hypothetical protein R3E02_05485 [Blastomonas sp.]
MRRIRAFLLSLSLLLGGFATPALAGEQSASEQKVSAIQFWKFSTCVVARDQWLVDEILAAERSGGEYKPQMKKLAEKNRDCLPRKSKLSISGKLFLGALAGASLSRKYDGSVLPDFSSIPQIYAIGDAPDGADNRAVLKMGLNQFAECLVRQAPAKVIGLLQTEPFSPAENEAFGVMQPEMGQCLPVIDGKKLGFTRLHLRTLFSAVAYDLDSRLQTQIAASAITGGTAR